MSGNRYLLDTNAIVALLEGNSQIAQLLLSASWIGVSVISQIEFLAFSGLSQDDRQLFQQFVRRVEVVGLGAGNAALIEQIIAVRQQHRLKLPDAIIAAMAIHHSANLVTADQELRKIISLAVVNW